MFRLKMFAAYDVLPFCMVSLALPKLGWGPDMVCGVLQCCFMGQVYRDAVRIHNRGSAAMKAVLSLPHALQPFLQAQPTAGFCQVSVIVPPSPLFPPRPPKWVSEVC